jgi:hypothetical protein
MLSAASWLVVSVEQTFLMKPEASSGVATRGATVLVVAGSVLLELGAGEPVVLVVQLASRSMMAAVAGIHHAERVTVGVRA